MGLPSAHRIVPPAVVAALVAACFAAPGVATAEPRQATGATGVSAKTSASRRPSPVRIRKRAPKAPRALPATGRRR